MKYWFRCFFPSPWSSFLWLSSHTSNEYSPSESNFAINNLQVRDFWYFWLFWFLGVFCFFLLATFANHRWLKKYRNLNPNKLEQTLVPFNLKNTVRKSGCAKSLINAKNEITGRSGHQTPQPCPWTAQWKPPLQQLVVVCPESLGQV